MGRMGDGAREGEDGGGEVARRRQDRASASARSTGGDASERKNLEKKERYGLDREENKIQGQFRQKKKKNLKASKIFFISQKR